MDVTLLYFDGCPNWQVLDERLRSLSAELGFEVTHERVQTPEAAAARHFIGSPTVLVDGHDPFARGDEPVGLACRIYQTPQGPAGAPTIDQLRSLLGPSGSTGASTAPQVPPAIVTRRIGRDLRA